MTGPEIGQRIQILRGERSQTAFAELLEISRSSLLRYEKGDRLPDGALLASICARLGANGHWLLLGEGEMWSIPEAAPNPSRSPQAPSQSPLLAEWDDPAGRGLSLAPYQAAAQAASHRCAWKVLTALDPLYPKGSSLVQIKAALKGDAFVGRTLEASLVLLMQADLVEEDLGSDPPTYRVTPGLGELHFRDDPEISAAVITLLEVLMKIIMPGVASRRGKLVTAEIRVPSGQSRALARAILSQLKAQVSQAAVREGGEERLSLVFGVAVDDSGVLNS